MFLALRSAVLNKGGLSRNCGDTRMKPEELTIVVLHHVLRFHGEIHSGRFGGMECGQRSQQQGGEEELEFHKTPLTS